MLYRKLGRTGLQVSILGFGCMRLPVLGGRHSDIDEERARQMLRYAIDQGVNYVDTAFSYHGFSPSQGGSSEPFLGRALQNGYRQRVALATKLPCWLVKNVSDMDRFLDQQLERLQSDHLEVYLLHALNAAQWPRLRDLGVLAFLDAARAEGRICHAGFSFHDELPLFMDIALSYDWGCCQIQYNYMDEDYQAGAAGLQFAADQGLGVIVMEPLRGGCLAGPVPPQVQAVWDRYNQRRSPAEWGLRYVWNHPGVSLALSGMSSLAQVEENLQTAANAHPGALSYPEIDLIGEARRAYRSLIRTDCTACQYCMPCPCGVDIPANFEILNDLAMFDNISESRIKYRALQGQKKDAGQCTGCGLCEMACPQFISIGEEMESLAAIFEK